jgi:hypothetical protein
MSNPDPRVSLKFRIPNRIAWIYHLKFDHDEFAICCLDEPTNADTALFDMLLESQGRREIRELTIACNVNQRPFCFSSAALTQFLTENERCKVLGLLGLTLSEDVCQTIVRSPRCLDHFTIYNCILNLQRFAAVLVASAFGTRIFMLSIDVPSTREPERNIGTIFVPVLKNCMLRSLYITYERDRSTRIGDASAIKAAFEANQGLEELYIDNKIIFSQPRELTLFLQGIAAAPKLRKFGVRIKHDTYSSLDICKMFAKALKDRKNNSLEVVTVLVFFNPLSTEFWNREVIPILHFNRERRRFQENRKRLTHEERLVRALEFTQSTDNHHFRFWLVRNHAGYLKNEQAQILRGKKRKRNTT